MLDSLCIKCHVLHYLADKKCGFIIGCVVFAQINFRLFCQLKNFIGVFIVFGVIKWQIQSTVFRHDVVAMHS